MAHDLFISYSTQDKAIADRLVHELEAKGVRCWIAPRDITYGSDWQQSILDAIAQAKALVLVFSAGANTSSTVRKEVLSAVESNVLVIPFRVEDVRPQGALRFNLIDVHWLDAVTPPLDPHIDLLVDRVSRLTQPLEDADPDPAPTPGPKRRRTRAKADAVEDGAGDAPVDPTPEPQPEPSPPKPVPPSPPPPPKPEDDQDKKQQRQNLIIVGAVALAVIVVLLLAFCRPKPDPTPLLDSNSSSGSSDSSSSSGSGSSSGGDARDISTQTSPDTKNREVTIYNSTGKTMTGLQAVKSGGGLGPNRLGGTLASGQSLKFNLSDGTEECYLWVRADFADGSHSSVDNFHVCGQSSLTFSETTGP